MNRHARRAAGTGTLAIDNNRLRAALMSPALGFSIGQQQLCMAVNNACKGERGVCDMAQDQLAHIAGITRQWANTLSGELRRLGIIIVHGTTPARNGGKARLCISINLDALRRRAMSTPGDNTLKPWKQKKKLKQQLRSLRSLGIQGKQAAGDVDYAGAIAALGGNSAANWAALQALDGPEINRIAAGRHRQQ